MKLSQDHRLSSSSPLITFDMSVCLDFTGQLIFFLDILLIFEAENACSWFHHWLHEVNGPRL